MCKENEPLGRSLKMVVGKVCLHVIFPRESYVTFRTFEGTLSSVSSHVLVQVALSVEALRADGALEEIFARVNPYVPHHIRRCVVPLKSTSDNICHILQA
ncbi:hypothetical protein CEXT_98271 [Caerostris extrusa]|uniref:Uncharacterized protein n=1 Tax=Caerostris extrusa TaxID=172846 RepID=A0AAV4PJ52_CAEEX|nr:hypothetical protein CEXT_98271 [Caerostris extrusa]